MAKIFLSYRRQDSAGVAGRIYDRLRIHFGEGAVFMDIDSIPIGEDFREHINVAVGQCDVVVAVIGTKWAGEANAYRRLHDPRDFVRIELESALHRNLPVIPVLVDRAGMPTEADLPPSLVRLAYKNALELDQGRDFHPHIDRLIRGIEFQFQRAKKLTNSLGMTLVHIEPGSFLMGSSKDQIDQMMRLFSNSKRKWFENEQPQHVVEITRRFYLGTNQVTQGQYRAVMGNNPSHFKGSDDRPVESVSWLEAVNFCNNLSAREKRTPFYRIDGSEVTLVGGNGYRLPTEAEWEHACRANSTTLYPFGDDASKLGEHAWFDGNSDKKTHPVGQKLPNDWGLYDMLGNVGEWCADGYGEKYYESAPPADPPGAIQAAHRAFRGGGWNNFPGSCRPANRDGGMPGNRGNGLGLRVAAVQV